MQRSSGRREGTPRTTWRYFSRSRASAHLGQRIPRSTLICAISATPILPVDLHRSRSLNEPFASRASTGRSLVRLASSASGWNVSCRVVIFLPLALFTCTGASALEFATARPRCTDQPKLLWMLGEYVSRQHSAQIVKSARCIPPESVCRRFPGSVRQEPVGRRVISPSSYCPK